MLNSIQSISTSNQNVYLKPMRKTLLKLYPRNLPLQLLTTTLTFKHLHKPSVPTEEDEEHSAIEE